MPRPKRPGWSKITITVSEEVSREIRILAASRGEEMGTLVDYAIKHLTGLAASRGGASSAIPSWIPARAIRPVEPRAVSLRATAIGRGNPNRVSEFVLQKLSENPIASPFTPLKHLKVTNRLSLQSISAPMLRSIISEAITAAKFEVGSESDPRTLKFLDAILQSVDRFIHCLQTAIPLDAERRRVWTRNSATAFGTLFGERITASLEKGTVEKASKAASVAVAEMVKTFLRRRPNALALLRDEQPIALVDYLVQDSRPRRRGETEPSSAGDQIDSSILS